MVVITHNRAIAPMANRVIDINNAKVRDVMINENPETVKNIEW
ncbi:hypothetical protein GCM10008932_16030 [Alkalibacterium iburiense]|uniref:ABC transporter ATP-binding protein n=1 Tax=Alkalibacterium iburiense TaxID=290589 RepID=A0ABN0XHW0_9LACT